MYTYYVDGEFVKSDKAVIPVDDLSITRGIGVFDLIRIDNGIPYEFKDHINRLRNSAEQIGIVLPWTQPEIMLIVRQTIEKNTIKNANLRIIVTGGSSNNFMIPSTPPRLIVIISPIQKVPLSYYFKGIKIITWNAKRAIPQAKSTDYIQASIALKKAREQNCDEALYIINNSGMISECTTSNIFAIINDKLVTPGRFILKGITRKKVIKLSKEILKIEVDIRDLKQSELLKAEEVFITGTTKGIVPVIKINNNIIGDGKPGLKTELIRQSIHF